MVKKIKANPHYVSSLLGPLALAVAKDKNSELLASVDYSNMEQRRWVIASLIKPSFDRLQDSTRSQLTKALAYFSSRPNALSETIEAKLLLCEVPPAFHHVFLGDLWELLFPGESAAHVAEGVDGIANRPLAVGEFVFDKGTAVTLDELVSELRTRLLG
jgi:hypothetical protein